ncbi:hypothetical protein E2C01_083312 [Portunus trituberculatus]|uniref:Uncharacterized protein n=1 Tax=Portunus trituberculatus TaxID=210409 RepID=A0A5B7IUT4_PORTR|nr:hypothetical protein [Portunus trituberculatus]
MVQQQPPRRHNSRPSVAQLIISHAEAPAGGGSGGDGAGVWKGNITHSWKNNITTDSPRNAGQLRALGRRGEYREDNTDASEGRKVRVSNTWSLVLPGGEGHLAVALVWRLVVMLKFDAWSFLWVVDSIVCALAEAWRVEPG